MKFLFFLKKKLYTLKLLYSVKKMNVTKVDKKE